LSFHIADRSLLITVLVLGSGLVSPPLIHYLDQHGFKVIVANRTLEHASKIVKGLKNTTAIQLDVETSEGLKHLEELVPKCDAVRRLYLSTKKISFS